MKVLFSSVLKQREQTFQDKYVNISKAPGVSYQKNSKQRQKLLKIKSISIFISRHSRKEKT